MILFYTDNKFRVHNQSYPGIPFLIDEKMKLVEEPNRYLRYIAVIKGRTKSPQTWKTYGNHLYEFFSFLEANCFKWDNLSHSHFAVWRDSMLERGCKRSTVNQRLTGVSSFYNWAIKEGKIKKLPFSKQDVWVVKDSNYLAHVDASSNSCTANELTLPTPKSIPKFLPLEQAITFIKSLSPLRNRLLAYLMLLTGIRREEAAKLNVNVLPNPAGCLASRSLKMTLDGEMTATKGNKSRWVMLPYSLAIKLWDYLNFIRPNLAKRYKANHGKQTEQLF